MGIALHTTSLGAHQRPIRILPIRANRKGTSTRLTVKAEIKYVNSKQARQLIEEEKYTVVDVRDESQYERAHIPESISVPLFIENKATDPTSLINTALVFGSIGWFSGSKYTIPNQNFVSDVEAKVGRDAKVLLVCQQGLRSGSAAEKLHSVGFNDIAYITGGLDNSMPGDLPKVGSVDLTRAGEGGVSRYRTQILISLSAVLWTGVALLQFFPEQSKEFIRFMYQKSME